MITLHNGRLQYEQRHIDHPVHGTDENPASDYHPLDREQIRVLLSDAWHAKRHAEANEHREQEVWIASRLMASIQIRLNQGVVGAVSPSAYSKGQIAIDERYVQFVESGYQELSNELVEWFYQTMKG